LWDLKDEWKTSAEEKKRRIRRVWWPARDGISEKKRKAPIAGESLTGV